MALQMINVEFYNKGEGIFVRAFGSRGSAGIRGVETSLLNSLHLQPLETLRRYLRLSIFEDEWGQSMRRIKTRDVPKPLWRPIPIPIPIFFLGSIPIPIPISIFFPRPIPIPIPISIFFQGRYRYRYRYSDTLEILMITITVYA